MSKTGNGLADVLPAIDGVEPAPQDFADLPDVHLRSRPVDLYRVHVAKILAQLTGCAPAVAYDAVQSTTALAKGDLVVPVPRLRLKGKIDELCADVAARFPDTHPLFARPVPTGIHLPIYLRPRPLAQYLLPYLFERSALYGHDHTEGAAKPKRVLVEFSSPNIAKEFHAGHLRSTIIGAFIANLYASMGWDVVKINYLGDWGKQFGLLAVGWKRYGSEAELARAPLRHLLEVYARINKDFEPEQEASKKARDEGRDTAEIESQGLFAERNDFFRRMEDGDDEALALWRRFRDISIDRYVATYARLNIAFDEYAGESQVQPESVQAVETLLKEKGVYEEENGSWLIDFKKHGAKALGVAVVRGRTGTTTYLLRDVGAVLERETKYSFDKMIYVVSSEQDLYFQRIFKVLELIGRADLAARVQHVNFGKVMGMSSRLGNVKLLSDILDQTADAMHDVMRRNATKYAQVDDPAAVADTVGIAAVMVQDMTGKRINNYPFDIKRMTSFEGDTGPYLQYCHARLCSLLRKAGLARADLHSAVRERGPAVLAALGPDLDTPHGADLVRLMAQYPDVTSTALRNLEPSTILTYLFRLAHQLSSAYDVLQVVGADTRESMVARAVVYESARQVLENGMRLLGLTPVERYCRPSYILKDS
ncbi:arginine-tRNA ligase [Sporothrix schenckii ATCC 58251]|uniref:arginine--tRNA ligase n=1 Tax=Sporothrix schenckii (strain ATCC 58251 / de Perez 2211183) TaxID=1391915 RepID=U7PS90_SPOS1|nr:arginine-tRNA ligase [Sporothrix schenckii ATCC 58251]